MSALRLDGHSVVINSFLWKECRHQFDLMDAELELELEEVVVQLHVRVLRQGSRTDVSSSA